jgi:hypothetical protein
MLLDPLQSQWRHNQRQFCPAKDIAPAGKEFWKRPARDPAATERLQIGHAFDGIPTAATACQNLVARFFLNNVGGTIMGRFPEYPLTPGRQVGTV